MKTIIEKIILSNFGKFIKGIQRDKLTIDLFGGNFKMENISLNQEYIDSLDTPFKLAYSSIGMLNIQAPLSKLSSVPVECVLDNIYMIFQFKNAQSQEQRKILQAFAKKSMALEKYIKELFNNYLQKIRDDKKEDGMFSKLGKKILDNLQLKIVNVHVRFQEKNKQHNYAWGVTLQQINLIPTDSQWKPTFIDRSQQSQKNEKMQKMMSVKNFNLYWQSGKAENSRIISQKQSQNQKKQIMSSMINKRDNLIIGITSKFKLVINAVEKLDRPIYELQIDLQPIKFELSRVQVSEIIDFVQKNMAQNELIIRNLTQKKSKKKQYSLQKQTQMKQIFQQYVSGLLDRQQSNSKQEKEFQFSNQMKSIIQSTEMDSLMLWSIDPVKGKVKKVRQIELKKKKRGWFGGQTQLTEEQLKQLEVFLEEALDIQKGSARPPECLFFKLAVKINGGKFIMIDRKGNDQQSEERIQFSIGNIATQIQKSQNQALMQVSLGIQNIGLDIILPSAIQGKINKMNILATENKFPGVSDKNSKIQKFFQLSYEKKVKTQGLQSQILTKISGNIQRIVVTYKKIYLKKFKQFFTFKNVNDYVRNTTLDKIQHIKDNENSDNKQQVQVYNIFDINLDVISPIFICPLNEQECWCLSLGTLEIKSKKNQEFETYPMNIKSAYLKYYPKISWLYQDIGYGDDRTGSMQHKQNLNQSATTIFSVIKNIDFHVMYKKNRQNSITDMELPNFQVNFTEQQYNHLLSLRNIFKSQDDSQNILETLKKQKLQIESQMTYQAPLNKKNDTLNTWKQYWAILSGPYLYFYNSKKELRYVQKVYIKNAKLTINVNNELELLSQQEDCRFQCQQIESLGKWKQQIESKIRTYKSIYQLMEYIEAQSQSEAQQSFSSRKGSHILQQKKFNSQIIFRVKRIGFKYENQNKTPLMKIQISQLKVQKFQTNKQRTTNFSMASLIIVDQLYKYAKIEYQTLLKTQSLSMSINKVKTTKKIRKGSIAIQGGLEKKQKQKKIVVKIDIPLLDINWKPDVLLVLINLSKKHFSKQKVMSVNDGQQFTRDTLLQQVSSDSKFKFVQNEYSNQGKGRTVKQNRQDYVKKQKWVQQLVRVQIDIGQMNITFIHRQSHLAMFKGVCQCFKTQFSMNQTQRYVSGSLNNLELYQLTGYPRKNYAVDSRYEPFKVLYKKNTDYRARSAQKIEQFDKPMLSFNWSSYEPMALPNQDRVNMFLYISVEPIECIYFQQVVFRLIDYILIQVMLLLQQPEMVTANQGLLQQLKLGKAENQKPIKILFSEYEQIVKKIISPYFIDMYFELHNPSIIIKAEKDSMLYYRADIEKLKFQNRNVKNSKRFVKCETQSVKGYIYEQQFLIDAFNVNFNVIEHCQKGKSKINSEMSIDQKNQKLSPIKERNQEEIIVTNLFGPVEMKVVFNKLIMEDQINTLYPEINAYDRAFTTNSTCSGIRIPNLSRNQYLHLQKLINFNITFDDENDELFIHNFQINKMLTPKPISYQLILPFLQIDGDLVKDVPLFSLKIETFKMVYKRNKDLNSSFNIQTGQTTMVAYEGEFSQKQINLRKVRNVIVDKNQKQDEPNIRIRQDQSEIMINIDKIKSRKSQPKQQRLNSGLKKQFNTTFKKHEILKIVSKQQQSMDVQVDMRTTGQKVINLNISNLDIVIQTALLQVVFQWSMPEDWIFPTVSTYLNEITFFATVHQMSASLKQSSQALLNARKQLGTFSQIQMFSSKSRSKFHSTPKQFKLQGVLCYKFHRKKVSSPQSLTESLLNKLLTVQDIEQMPESSYMTVILNTELYHANVGSPQKRKVLQKFTFNLMQKRYLKVADHQTFILKPISKRNMGIDKALLKISFTDIILMKSLLNQMQEERKYIVIVNKLLGKDQMQGQGVQTQLSSLQNLDFQIQTISLYIINNIRQRFTPVLRMNMNNINLTKCNTKRKDMMEGNLTFALFYFNVSIFKWEPFLEKTAVAFHRLVYYQENKAIISLQFTHPLMLNVSKQMFTVAKETIAEWKKSITNNNSCSYNQNQPVQFISHYIIRNQTGYPIEIYNSQKLKKNTIQNQSQIDYQYQFADYDDQKEDEILIGVRIMHPMTKFKTITNLTISPQKQFSVVPQTIAGNEMGPNAQIIFSPQIKYSKQYLIIKSNKRIINYTVNPTQVTILPFDFEDVVTLHQFMIKVSLFKEMEDKQRMYRFIGTNGTLKIMKRYLVYNCTPIPLDICGTWVPPNEYIGISQKLRIQGRKQKDSMFKVTFNETLREYYIYCQAYVVDYYGLEFNFGHQYEYKAYRHKVQLKDYSCTVYIMPNPQYRFQIRMNRQSKYITCKPSIGKTIMDLENNQSICQFSIYTYITPLENSPIKQFKKVIEITPEIVLSNMTKQQIKISQVQSCTSLTIDPLERTPFFWQSKKRPRAIKLAVYDGKQFWGYSGPIQIQQSTQSIIMRKGSDPKQYRVFSCQVERTNTITFLHIIQTTPKYFLVNRVPNSTLNIYQRAIIQSEMEFNPDQFVYRVKCGQEKPFGYQMPMMSHQVTVQIQFDQTLQQYKGVKVDPISLEDIELNLFEKQVTLYRLVKQNRGQGMGDKWKKNKLAKMKLILQFQGNVKKLKFLVQTEQANQEAKFEFLVKIPHLGFSFIGMDKGIRKQLIHLIIERIQFQMNRTDLTVTQVLEVGSVRLQNLLQLNVQFPVLLQSARNKAGICLIFQLSRDTRNQSLIKSFSLRIGQFFITITSEEIQIIQNNVLQIMAIKVWSDQQANLILRPYELYRPELPHPEESLYFVNAQISPLSSVVTFKHVNDWGGKLLKAFSSISQCHISVNGKRILHFSCKNIVEFFNHVLEHYRQGLSQNLLPLIGNLSILGSPMVLVQKIGSGFKDLIELPAQGFEISAKQGGIGIAKGARSLVKNTFHGTFNSLESLTGSLGNGLSSLVDDEQYNRKRERIRNERSDNIGDGLLNAGKSIANGFQKGITGVISKPLEGAQRDGIAGFFIGGFKGITGLIIKPITGIVDATAKTAEGIKNTANNLSPQQKLALNRKHNPRPFYRLCRQFRQNDVELAFCAKILQTIDSSKYTNLSWSGCYLLKQQIKKEQSKQRKSQTNPILLVTYEYLVFYDLKRFKLIKSYHSSDLYGVQLGQGTNVIVYIRDRKNNNKQGRVNVQVIGNPRRLHNQIKLIIKSYRPTYSFDYQGTK